MNLVIALIAIVSFVAGASTVALVAYLADRAIRRKYDLQTEAQVILALAAHEAAQAGGR